MLSIVMLMLAQEVTGPPGDEPVLPLTTLTRQRICQPGTDDDIVVCGGGVESQRLEPLPEWRSPPVFRPAVARVSPNKSVGVQAQEGGSPFSEGPRAMISFKLDF